MVRVAVAALLSLTLVACQGEQDPDGAISNRYCSRASANYAYQYQVTRYASGDVEVMCSVADVIRQYTATIHYRSGDAGTATGRCWLYYDVDAASGGYWDFRADAPGERATYVDATSDSNGWVETFAPGECTG